MSMHKYPKTIKMFTPDLRENGTITLLFDGKEVPCETVNLRGSLVEPNQFKDLQITITLGECDAEPPTEAPAARQQPPAPHNAG